MHLKVSITQRHPGQSFGAVKSSNCSSPSSRICCGFLGIRLFLQILTEIILDNVLQLLKVLHDGGFDKLFKSPINTLVASTASTGRTSSPDEKPSLSPMPSESQSKSTNRNRLRRGPKVWPQPNTPSIFDRPFPHITGRRRVPRLVVASGFPFLRIKKPQSQYLGRIIRDDLRLFHQRIQRFQQLEGNFELGLNEDRWDEILESTCGVKKAKNRGESSWSHMAGTAKHEISTLITQHREKRADMARRMQEIVDKEQALADQERLQRRTEKHRERKQRRLERKAASEEGTLDA